MANSVQIYFFHSTSAAVLCSIIDLISNFRGMLNSLTGLCLHFSRAKIALLFPRRISLVQDHFLLRLYTTLGEINRFTVGIQLIVQTSPQDKRLYLTLSVL